jgi:integrase
MAERLQEHGVKPPEDGIFNDRWLERGARPLPFAYQFYDRKQTGLGITVEPNGKKKFFLQTVFPGQRSQARRKLGVYQWPPKGQGPTMSLKAARQKAAEQLALVKDGIDPADAAREKAEAAAEERRAKSKKDANKFAAAVIRYTDEVLVKHRRGKAVARELAYLVKEWGDRPLESIEPVEDIKTVIVRIARRTPYQAQNIYGGASALFRWAVDEGLLKVSPMASLSKKRIFKGMVGPRERILDKDEIKAFWAASGQLPYPMRQVYQTLLLTGARVSEISQARWRELDPELRRGLRTETPVADEHKVLVVPAARFKSNTEHRIQLSDDAVAILAHLPKEALARSATANDFIFSTTGGRKAVNGMSKSKAELDKLMTVALQDLARSRGDDPNAVTLKPFVTHDLRRVVRSHVGAIKLPLPTEDEKLLPKEQREARDRGRHNIPDHICEMVLGHGRKGLQRIYDLDKHAPEIREALTAWAAKLREIVTPPTTPTTTAENVVKLRKRKAS